MPQKSWAVGEEVLAADFNTYLQNQTVPTFTSTAERDSQWPSPPWGSMCVTTDTGRIWQRIGGVWWMPYTTIVTATRTSDAGPQGAEAVFLTTTAVTLPVGRRVRLEAGFRSIDTTGTPDGFAVLRIRDGTTTAGTARMEIGIATNTAQSGSGGTVAVTYAAAGTSQQWSLTLTGVVGNATIRGAVGYPIRLEVIDMGAA